MEYRQKSERKGQQGCRRKVTLKGGDGTKEVTEGKGKAATYVRWFFVGAFGLIIIFTVIMAVYRKFGG
jgi:hypothetical protein